MFDEINKSIKAILYERVSSPLAGSFIISWIIINWKIVLAIFSSLPVKLKIDFIQTLNPTVFHYLIYGLITPFISSLLFILIYPKITKKIYHYWHKEKVELQNEKLKLEQKRLLTQEESQKIITKLILLENSKNEEITSKDKEIEQLKENIKVLQNNEPEIKHATLSNEKPLNDFETKLLPQLVMYVDETNRDGFSVSNIASYTGEARTKVSLTLDDLTSKGYLTQSLGNYTLTKKGKTEVINL